MGGGYKNGGKYAVRPETVSVLVLFSEQTQQPSFN